MISSKAGIQVWLDGSMPFVVAKGAFAPSAAPTAVAGGQVQLGAATLDATSTITTNTASKITVATSLANVGFAYLYRAYAEGSQSAVGSGSGLILDPDTVYHNLPGSGVLVSALRPGNLFVRDLTPAKAGAYYIRIGSVLPMTAGATVTKAAGSWVSAKSKIDLLSSATITKNTPFASYIARARNLTASATVTKATAQTTYSAKATFSAGATLVVNNAGISLTSGATILVATARRYVYGKSTAISAGATVTKATAGGVWTSSHVSLVSNALVEHARAQRMQVSTALTLAAGVAGFSAYVKVYYAGRSRYLSAGSTITKATPTLRLNGASHLASGAVFTVAGWTATIPMPVAWFTPEALDALQLPTGQPVSSWNDVSGGGHHATQATASRKPTYTTALCNGKSGALFNSVNYQYLALQYNADLWTTAKTIIVVHRPDSLGNSNGIVSACTLYGAGGEVYARQGLNICVGTSPHSHVAAYYAKDNVSGYIEYPFTSTIVGQWHISTAISNVTANQTKIWNNGSPGYFNTGYIGQPSVQSSPVIGRFYTDWDGLNFAGAICEVLIYNRALSVAEREQVEAYLGLKYNIPILSDRQSYMSAAATTTTAAVRGYYGTSTLAAGAAATTRAGVVIPGANSTNVITGTAEMTSAVSGTIYCSARTVSASCTIGAIESSPIYGALATLAGGAAVTKAVASMYWQSSTISLTGTATSTQTGVWYYMSPATLDASADMTAAAILSSNSFAYMEGNTDATILGGWVTCTGSSLAAGATQSTRGINPHTGNIKLLINNINRTSWFGVDNLRVVDELNTRNTLSCRLNIPHASVGMPIIGQTIELYNSTTVVFAGTIDRLYTTMEGHCGTVYVDIEAVDWCQLCDRHLVARVYTDKGVSVIVKDIVQKYLAGDGITDGGVVIAENEIVIKKAVFNYNAVSECLNELCDMTGYMWYVDYGKVLHFVPREQFTSPWNIAENTPPEAPVNAPLMNIKVLDTRELYRNKQVIRVPKAATGSRTEKFKGDWERRTFTLAYPVLKLPEHILLNGVEQTIGVRGEDTGTDFYTGEPTQNTVKDWYYAPGEKEISQNDDSFTNPSLTELDTLSVTYIGSFPAVVIKKLDNEIAARQAVEGGTGLYEYLEMDDRVESLDQGKAWADGLLRRYGEIPHTFTFDTDKPGLVAGQLITITMPYFGVTGDWLISSIETIDINGLMLRYTVTCLSGEAHGGWIEFYKRLAGVSYNSISSAYLVRDDETVIMYEDAGTDTLTFTDEVVVAVIEGATKVEHAQVEAGEVSI